MTDSGADSRDQQSDQSLVVTDEDDTRQVLADLELAIVDIQRAIDRIRRRLIRNRLQPRTRERP